jgi:hypothetical protein
MIERERDWKVESEQLYVAVSLRAQTSYGTSSPHVTKSLHAYFLHTDINASLCC